MEEAWKQQLEEAVARVQTRKASQVVSQDVALTVGVEQQQAEVKVQVQQPWA